jgi:predicted transglutaminase-like cysteine proteinase
VGIFLLGTGRPIRRPHRAGVLLGSVLLCLSLPAQAGKPYPFDSSGLIGDASLMPDWAATMQRQRTEAVALDACLDDELSCPSYYRGLRHLLLRAAELSPERQISLINRYVNRKRYNRDRTRRMQTPLTETPVKYRSHWSTVQEFMRGGGDCEDYATTKYYLLRRLGFPVDRLRVVVTYDREVHGYHAVLAVRNDDDEVLLLESNNTIVRGRNHRYHFIYSVNEKSIWDHEAAAASASRDRHQQEETPA